MILTKHVAASLGLRPCRPALRVRAFVEEAAGRQHASPTSADLLRDGKLAALSGLCYVPPADLSARLQHAGLELQAHGTTHFTRWSIARQAPAAAGASLISVAGQQPQPQQFIFFRGVSWRSADLDALRVWQGLMRALPSPFLPHLTSPPELLLAHRCVGLAPCALKWAPAAASRAAAVRLTFAQLLAASCACLHACACASTRLPVQWLARSGVAEMAEELFEVLRPHMEGQSQLHLAGHSLGGSLATLVALTAHLRLGGSGSSSGSGTAANSQQQQQPLGGGGLQVQCTTFGSPPVLALAAGAGEDGGSMLQALRMPPGSVRNYVLQVGAAWVHAL